MRSSIANLVTLAVVVTTGLTGCGAKQEPEETVEAAYLGPPRARTGNLDRSGFRAEPADINQDGTPDQTVYYSGNAASWAERDLDFDGRPEIYEYFASNGDVVEQEFQLDFDSAIDSVRYYEGGNLVRKDFSTDYEGTFTLFKYYDVDGTLLRVERDNDFDGSIDIWEYYEFGELRQLGRDQDNDGSPEVIEEID